jgi:transposase-like protein
MPKKYSAEFRLRSVALVRAGGKTITQTAYELEVEILRRASKILEVGHHDPKEFTR